MPNALIFFLFQENNGDRRLSSQNQANNVPDCEYVSSDCINLPSTLLLDFLRIRQQQKKSKIKQKPLCPRQPESKPSAETSEGDAGIVPLWWPLIHLQVG